MSNIPGNLYLEGHEGNTQNVDVCFDIFVSFFCFILTSQMSITLALLMICWVPACVCVGSVLCGTWRAWVFAYVRCVRTPEREWTTECWCLCLVGKVRLFNSHLHICVYRGVQKKKIWPKNTCLCRQKQYSFLSTFLFCFFGFFLPYI